MQFVDVLGWKAFLGSFLFAQVAVEAATKKDQSDHGHHHLNLRFRSSYEPTDDRREIQKIDCRFTVRIPEKARKEQQRAAK